MIKPHTRFQLHPSATVLNTNVAGIRQLLACVRAGTSIVISQDPQLPIVQREDAGQWLECQTSGSTGSPKTIRRRPESWIASFEISKAQFGITCADTYAVLGNLTHSLSLFASLEALHIGAKLACLCEESPKAQVAAIADHGVTVLYATPTQLRQIFGISRHVSISGFPRVQKVFVGGGTLSRETKIHVRQMFPNACVREFYGTSETSFITISDQTTPDGAVGAAYPDVTLKTEPIGDGDIGEVWVKSPYVFDGYAGADTSLIMNNGFYGTGELGYLDQAGNLFLKGRKDRMVTIADINVYPEEIEAAVLSLLGVSECAVITAADDTRGHHAICVIEANSPVLTQDVVRRHCRAKLPAALVPRVIRFTPKMPLLRSGKPDLVALKQLCLGAE